MLAVLLVAGCKSGTDRPVSNITMADVIVEFHLANARLEITGTESPGLRDSILIAHGFDSTSYAQAVAFYAENPKEYGEVYSRVLDRLNAERLPLSDAPLGDP